jgi:hypothetical protein
MGALLGVAVRKPLGETDVVCTHGSAALSSAAKTTRGTDVVCTHASAALSSAAITASGNSCCPDTEQRCSE